MNQTIQGGLTILALLSGLEFFMVAPPKVVVEGKQETNIFYIRFIKNPVGEPIPVYPQVFFQYYFSFSRRY